MKRSNLEPGDTLEYSMTLEATSPRGAKTWIKVGTTITVQGDEDEAAAKERASNIVEPMLVEKLGEWTE